MTGNKDETRKKMHKEINSEYKEMANKLKREKEDLRRLDRRSSARRSYEFREQLLLRTELASTAPKGTAPHAPLPNPVGPAAVSTRASPKTHELLILVLGLSP